MLWYVSGLQVLCNLERARHWRTHAQDYLDNTPYVDDKHKRDSLYTGMLIQLLPQQPGILTGVVRCEFLRVNHLREGQTTAVPSHQVPKGCQTRGGQAGAGGRLRGVQLAVSVCSYTYTQPNPLCILAKKDRCCTVHTSRPKSMLAVTPVTL